MVPLRCLIVDDNDLFLQVASQVLEGEGIAVVGVSTTSADALRCFGDLRPDVALVDIDLGEESGFDLAWRLVEVGKEAADAESSSIILISACAENDFLEMIAESPAVAFLSKSELSAEAIRETVRKADC